MREDITPKPKPPREILIECALTLRRLSGRMHSMLREPETIQMPVTLRCSLTAYIKEIDECAVGLEELAATATATRGVPIWRDGVKVALGVLIPFAVFACLIALCVSAMQAEPTDPEQIHRSLSDTKWIPMHEDRLEASSGGGNGN